MTLLEVASLLGGVGAFLAVCHATVEHQRQGAQKRAEMFLAMRRRFKDDHRFSEICRMLVRDEEGLQRVPYVEKRDFLGFLEEVAILTNSGLLRPHVSYYMFGSYALLAADSRNFWSGPNVVDRKDKVWSLYEDYVARMRRVAEAFVFHRRRLRF